MDSSSRLVIYTCTFNSQVNIALKILTDLKKTRDSNKYICIWMVTDSPSTRRSLHALQSAELQSLPESMWEGEGGGILLIVMISALYRSRSV